MARYLVIANKTAASDELREALLERVKHDSRADFTLLVPIAYAGVLMFAEDEDDLRVVARARRVGEAAAQSLIVAGVNISQVMVGDELPIVALEEELKDPPGEYQEIILATLPESLSRWVQTDQLRQAEKRFGLPVSHIICTPAGWASE